MAERGGGWKGTALFAAMVVVALGSAVVFLVERGPPPAVRRSVTVKRPFVCDLNRPAMCEEEWRSIARSACTSDLVAAVELSVTRRTTRGGTRPRIVGEAEIYTFACDDPELAATTAGPAGPWSEFENNDIGIWELDRRSIKKVRGKVRSVRTRILLSGPYRTSNRATLHEATTELLSYEVDCDSQATSMLRTQFVRDDGAMVGNFKKSDPSFSRVVPGSLYAILLARVCSANI